MTTKTQKLIYIISTIIILLLSAACVYLYIDNKKKTNVVPDINIRKAENEYVEVYESETLDDLQKENETLYNEIEHLKDADNAVEIKYEYIINTDTVFVPIVDNFKDSIYNYTFDNDTINYNLTISAYKLNWHQENIKISDKFIIVNSELDANANSIIVKHSENVDIIDVNAWKKKTKFKEHIFYGPSVGVGYGCFHNNVDLYIGVSAGYKF